MSYWHPTREAEKVNRLCGCDRLHFPKMATLIYPIPHALLKQTLKLPLWDTGSKFLPLESGWGSVTAQVMPVTVKAKSEAVIQPPPGLPFFLDVCLWGPEALCEQSGWRDHADRLPPPRWGAEEGFPDDHSPSPSPLDWGLPSDPDSELPDGVAPEYRIHRNCERLYTITTVLNPWVLGWCVMHQCRQLKQWGAGKREGA